jgi:predicted transcriptional regulator
MNEITLNDFCGKFSQAKAAEIMGCSQSAVSQMVSSGRDIRFIEGQDGTYTHFEIKIPAKKKAA